MTNQITLNAEVVTEGKSIAKAIRQFDGSFAKAILDGKSIDVRLGKFLMELNKLADQHGLKGKAKSGLLSQAGVANIDKRRRSDAVQLATNLVEIQEFIKSTKWKGNHTTRLLADWKKATVKPTASDDTSKAGDAKSSKASSGKSATGSVEPNSLDGQQLATLILSVAKDRKAVEEMMAHLSAAMQRQDEKAANNVVAISA
jgi:hypothetical protein